VKSLLIFTTLSQESNWIFFNSIYSSKSMIHNSTLIPFYCSISFSGKKLAEFQSIFEWKGCYPNNSHGCHWSTNCFEENVFNFLRFLECLCCICCFLDVKNWRKWALQCSILKDCLHGDRHTVLLSVESRILFFVVLQLDETQNLELLPLPWNCIEYR